MVYTCGVLKIFETAANVLVEGEKGELDSLVDEFAFKPDGYWYAPSYERYVVSKGKEGWDGFLRPVRRIAWNAAKALRGRKGDIITWARENGFECDTKKTFPLPFAHLTIDDVPPDLIAGEFQLDDSQRRCILQWMRHAIGINQVTVSGGKTAMFAGAIAFIKRHYPKGRAIYLTPSERLVRQSTKELRRMLPKLDVGQFGGGKDEQDAEDVVVCTVAMLNRHFPDLLSAGWFKRFLCICYDEVHHSASESSQRVLLAIPAFFRLGASDTTKEKDERRWSDIRGLFGPVYNVIKAAPLIAEGRIAKPHIYIVDQKPWLNKFQHVNHDPFIGSKAFVLSTDGQWSVGRYQGPVIQRDDAGNEMYREVKTAEKDDQDKWVIEQKPVILTGLHRITFDGVEHEVASKWCLLDRLYDRCIIQFNERNDLIVKWAKHFSDRGLPTVIVCTRTLHVYILEQMLSEVIKPKLISTLIGNDSPAARDACFDKFKKTAGAVLITPLVKEGVSINEIRAGIVADYVADAEVANQIVGRFIRPKKSGENCAEIVWFRDKQHPSLRRGCNSVFRWLAQIEGYTFYDPAPDIDQLTFDFEGGKKQAE
jgi:superfamily II DNA or RNA helicase